MDNVKGPVRLFPLLYNIEDFKNTDHPEYHPSTQMYLDYWTEQEKFCLEGKWGYDHDGKNGGWRYMPGNLYYYINLCKIILEKDGAVETSNPFLRDVEWMLAYGWLSARKFSGFEGDKYKTCHRLVKKIKDKGFDALTPDEQVRFMDHEPNLRDPDGELKEYVPAVEYLYSTHSEPLGRCLYQNSGLNFFVLGSRGFGKSYFCGNAVIGHEYNFYGKKHYNDKYLKNPSPVEIFVGSALGSKSSELLSKFKMTQDYLKTGPGAYGSYEDFEPGFFFNSSKGTLGTNNASNPYRDKYDIKEGGEWNEKGTGTKIVHGIYTTENPQAAVGTRPSVMVIEEVGLLGNLLDVHGANETCLIRDTRLGSSFYIGTGGNMEKIVESKIVFEDPEAYDFVPYEDKWENRERPIGFFMPSYYVSNNFKDKNGNTDLEASFAQEEYERSIRRKASSASALTQYMMARPIVPSEMFLSSQNTHFPVALLKERYVQLAREKIVKSVGYFEYTDSTRSDVKWMPDPTLRPIEEINLKSGVDTSGAFVIYEHPPEDKPMFALHRPFYKIVYDPVKDDEYGRSLASVLVYKGFVSSEWEDETGTLQDDIVGEFIGRRERVEDIHEIVVMAAMYFGGRVLVENNLPDFIRYCRIRRKYEILQPNPHEAMSKLLKNPSKKYQVGVTMSKQLNVQCELLINDILNSEWKVTDEGVKEWLFKLKSKRLLLELINYDREKNFDHVSAIKLLALWNKNDLEYKTDHSPNREDFRKKWDDFAEGIGRKQTINPFYGY